MPSVWSAVAHFTFTSRPDSASKLIVNDTLLPSVAVASSIDTVGMASSSVIVICVWVKESVPDFPLMDRVSMSSSQESSVGVSAKST